MNFEVINEANSDVYQTLVTGVRDYNIENMGDEKKRLSVAAYDEQGKIIGGVSGVTIYHHFLVEVVWVDKACRGTGIGRQVMELAEQEAKKRGCVAAQVDTLSFQAPNFYRKLGFEIVGQISGFSEHPDRFFLLKRY